MKKNLKASLVLIFLVSGLLVGFDDPYAIISEEPYNQAFDREDNLDRYNQFRSLYGLDEITQQENEVSQPHSTLSDFELELGFSLSNEEKRILSIREHQLEQSKEARSYFEKNFSDVFGGSYFDSKTGETTIFLTESITDLQDHASFQRLDESNVKFEVVQHTLKELVAVSDKLTFGTENFKELNINMYSVDETENKVVLYSEFGKEVNVEKLQKILDLKKVKFEKANFKLLFNLELGENIRGATGAPLNISSTCSSGFYGVNSANQAVLVTAGHCNKVGLNMSWYKGNPSQGNFIGNFQKKVTGTYQNSDASSILLSNSVTIQPRIGLFNLTSVNSNAETSGQTIYYKGQSTGANYGSFSGGICIPPETHGDSQMGTLCDLGTVSNLTPASGDSGGVVFTVPSGARLHGILTGGMDTNNDGVYDRMVFSRIGYIINDLNLKSVIVY